MASLLWISPATLEIQQRESARIFCMACATLELIEAGAMAVEPPSAGQLNELYAASSGWATALKSAAFPKRSRFFWRNVEWEVATYFTLPCCGLEIALVRRVGSGLETWTGLGCPTCGTGETYTVEQSV